MKNIIKISIFLFAFTFSNLFSQNADEYIDKVKKKMREVSDFIADLNVKIDISYLNAPEMNGKIYFKQPNKTHIEMQGFSMLPKQGSGNFVNDLLLTKGLTYIATNQQDVEGRKCRLIKVVPTSNDANFLIATLWVDEREFLVRKAEITSKDNGTFLATMSYKLLQEKFQMVDKVTIKISVPNFSLPKSITGDSNASSKPEDMKGNTEGTVTVKYSNYKLNTNFSDDIFKGTK